MSDIPSTAYEVQQLLNIAGNAEFGSSCATSSPPLQPSPDTIITITVGAYQEAEAAAHVMGASQATRALTPKLRKARILLRMLDSFDNECEEEEYCMVLDQLKEVLK